MSSYLHCNRCGAKNTKRKVALILFSCKHVVCNTCTKGQSNLCVLCAKPAKAIPLQKNEPETMRVFTENPLQKMKEAQDVEMFQLQQQMSFFGFYDDIQEKYKQVKAANANLDKEIHAKKEEFEKKMTVIKKLRAEIKKKSQDESTSSSSMNMSHSSGHSSVGSLSFLSTSSGSLGPKDTTGVTPKPSQRSQEGSQPLMAQGERFLHVF